MENDRVWTMYKIDLDSNGNKVERLFKCFPSIYFLAAFFFCDEHCYSPH